MCTVRYDSHGRPSVTASLKRGSRAYASGSTNRGKPLRLRSKSRMREGSYTLVRTYNGRSIKMDSVYVIVVH